MKKYIKTERPNLFEPNVYISMVVKLEGDISAEKIKTAVKSAYEKNEATMSKIVLEKSGKVYYEMMEKSGCKIFFDNRKWQDILEESEKTPFELWNGELIRTYIDNSNKENPIIFIMAHHLVGDGKAIICFIENILKLLSGELISFQPMKLIEEKKMEKLSHFPSIIRWKVQKDNNKWKKKGKVFGWDDYLKIHHTYWNSKKSKILIEEYNEHEIEQMKKYCTNGITLNSYLVTLLEKRYLYCKTIGIPISIRNGNTSISNQTSGIRVKNTYNKNNNFEKNLEKVHRNVRRRLNNNRIRYFILPYMALFNPSLLDAILLESCNCYNNKISMKLAKSMGYIGKNGTDLGITNLTTINIKEKYSEFVVKDIFFIPPKVSYAKYIIGIATFGNKLLIIHHEMINRIN